MAKPCLTRRRARRDPEVEGTKSKKPRMRQQGEGEGGVRCHVLVGVRDERCGEKDTVKEWFFKNKNPHQIRECIERKISFLHLTWVYSVALPGLLPLQVSCVPSQNYFGAFTNT